MATLARRTLVTSVVGFAVGLAIGLALLGAAQAHVPAASVGVVPAAAAAAARTASPGALDAAVPIELDALLAADTTAARPDRTAVRGALRRLAAWEHLVHATAVVDLKDGGLTTIQLDHGTISAVSGTSLTIAEDGGGSVTVALGGETRIRRDGAKAAVGDLKTADAVFVMSKVEAGGTTAYLVVVRRR